MKKIFKSRLLRPGLVVALIIALFVMGRFMAGHPYFSLDHIRQTIEAAGAWGYLMYFVFFVLGELMHVFGLIFVAAGVFAYGKIQGYILALTAGTLAVCVSFLLMRKIGGRAFSDIKRPWVQRILARLDQKPIRSVILLRIFLILHPSLNYLLALTRIRFRDYLVGSAIGLVIPLGVFVIFFDWIIKIAN